MFVSDMTRPRQKIAGIGLLVRPVAICRTLALPHAAFAAAVAEKPAGPGSCGWQRKRLQSDYSSDNAVCEYPRNREGQLIESLDRSYKSLIA
jgi:hypothetical protein